MFDKVMDILNDRIEIARIRRDRAKRLPEINIQIAIVQELLDLRKELLKLGA